MHGQPEAGRNAAPANYAERDIREFFLVPFQAAVREAQVQSVMASYNEINGIPMHVNHWLLRDVLRQEWGFGGFITSDGGGIRQLVTEHHVAADTAEAARKVLQAGIDFELDTCFDTLLQQVRDGVVPEALIDTAVARDSARQVPAGLVRAAVRRGCLCRAPDELRRASAAGSAGRATRSVTLSWKWG